MATNLATTRPLQYKTQPTVTTVSSSRARSGKNLIVVTGHAGVGKTTFAQMAANSANWVLVDKDTLYGRLVDLITPDDRQSSQYVDTVQPIEYESLLDTVFEILQHGSHTVIMVAPFTTNQHALIDVQNRATQIGVNVIMVRVECDLTVQYERIVNRNLGQDEWKINHWFEWLESHQQPELDSIGIVPIFNNGTLQDLWDLTEQFINTT